MEELEIQGKNYISSKRASDLTGYAKDYVGQLAREGKVPATRVGRSWYVDELAIVSHSRGGLDSNKQNEVKTNIEINKTISLHSLKQAQKSSLNTWGHIKYITDDSELLPQNFIQNNSDKETQKIEIKKKNIVSPRRQNGHVVEGIKPKEKQIYIPQKLKKHNRRPLILVGGVSAAILVIIASGGIYTPSIWAYGDIDLIQMTASVFSSDFLFVSEIFSTIFSGGIQLIGEFLSTIIESLSDFFNLGYEFILNIVKNILG